MILPPLSPPSDDLETSVYFLGAFYMRGNHAREVYAKDLGRSLPRPQRNVRGRNGEMAWLKTIREETSGM